MSASPEDFTYEKSAHGGRYFKVMPNGQEARITFVDAGDGHIIADHTFVPAAYRGQGLAEALVDRLIAEARASGTRITPTCWYVAQQFDRHPEWDDVLKH